VQDGKIAAKTSTGACAPAHNSADIELNGPSMADSAQLRRQSSRQSRLAGSAPPTDKAYNVERASRLDGAGWSGDARRRPAHRQRLVALRRLDVNGQRMAGFTNIDLITGPAARDQPA